MKAVCPPLAKVLTQMINLIRRGDVREVAGVVKFMEAGRVRGIGEGVGVVEVVGTAEIVEAAELLGGFGLREIRGIGKGVEVGEVEVEAEAEGISEDLGRVEIVREMGEKTGNFSRILPEIGTATLAARKVEGGSRTDFGILKMEEVRTFAKVLFCMRRIGFEW